MRPPASSSGHQEDLTGRSKDSCSAHTILLCAGEICLCIGCVTSESRRTNYAQSSAKAGIGTGWALGQQCARLPTMAASRICELTFLGAKRANLCGEDVIGRHPFQRCARSSRTSRRPSQKRFSPIVLDLQAQPRCPPHGALWVANGLLSATPRVRL